MVLESLLSARVAEERPAYDFLYGVGLSIASLGAGYFLFPAISSLISVVLLSIGIVPVLMKIFYYEEREEDRKKSFFEAHLKAFRFFLVFFLAVSATFGILHYCLPRMGLADVSERLFSEQIREITSISNTFQSGKFSSSILENPTVGRIISNNLIVLYSSFVLSLLFGGGAAFVLAWNASVFGIFLSISSEIHVGAAVFSFIYAIPELVAYYVGGFSGGMLSAEFSTVLGNLSASPKIRTKLAKTKTAGTNPTFALLINSGILLLAASAIIAVMGAIEGILLSL